jgi:hypothetical protein
MGKQTHAPTFSSYSQYWKFGCYIHPQIKKDWQMKNKATKLKIDFTI